MSYLSYNTVSVALNCLRDAVPGRIDLYSGLQYLAGLNRYCKKHEVYKVDCKISANKKEIIANIIDVVKLDDERYLKSFKEIVNGKKRHIDQASSSINSNFFNGSSFDLSKNIKDTVFDYPQKEGYSLLKIQDCNLILDEELYANVHNYLQSETQLVSFAIWLLRNCGDFEAISISSLRDTLKSFYTDKFVDLLIPIHIDESIIKIELSDSPAKINSKDFYEAKDDMANKQQKKEYSLQKIVYGAPGTGKSFATDDKIKEIYPSKDDQKDNVFRTTFHPDSDYSTFVGAYKPTTSKIPILNQTQLIKELNRMIAEEGAHALDQFAYKYWESFEYDINKDALLQACDKANQSSHLNSGIALGKKFQRKNNAISYSFVPQSFSKAYVQAWKNYISGDKKTVFLVIEEINRGNCAQIFGDLFQLLDRDDETDMSCYPIKPDTDLGNYIADELADLASKAPEWQSILEGEELLLPSNFHIWATMNTSDQSLFPIDSAFKRRWKWEYVKIADKKKDWKIKFTYNEGDEEKSCDKDWWTFIEQINKIIASMTSSADKQLGYFFCKPDKKEDGAEKNTIISEEVFVGKVVFYLWNDVFKNYAMDEGNLFKFKAKPDAKEEDLTFPDFYDEEGNVNGYVAAQFIDHVMAWEKDKED